MKTCLPVYEVVIKSVSVGRLMPFNDPNVKAHLIKIFAAILWTTTGKAVIFAACFPYSCLLFLKQSDSMVVSCNRYTLQKGP